MADIIEFPNKPAVHVREWANVIIQIVMGAGNDPELGLAQDPRACAIGALFAAACLIIGSQNQKTHVDSEDVQLFEWFLRHFAADGKIDDKEWAFMQ